MSVIPSLGALRTLVRWRGFQETQRANGYRKANAEVARCQGQIDSAKTRLQHAHQHRANVLAAGLLDIGLLQIAGALEERAQCALAEHEQAFEAVEAVRLSAQEAYVAARALSRVAQDRQIRLERTEGDRLEKVQFDRMADLVVGKREFMS